LFVTLLSQNIADQLLQIKAIQLNPQNPYTWASGLRSPIYCDNRQILSFPEARKHVIFALARVSSEFADVDAIAGVATAGIPWGAYVADRLDLPYCYVRSKPKDHGLKNLIEGKIPTGSNVVVVEDLVSTGGSSFEAIEALKAEGMTIAGVVCIFHYGFAQTLQKFAENKVECKSLTNFSILLERSLHSQYISGDDFTKLKSWNLNPKAWSDQFQSSL